MADPKGLDRLPHSSTIYHQLLGPNSTHAIGSPSAHSVLEETQTQVFAGESSGLTLMHGTFYILRTPHVYRRLKEELFAAWPHLNQPPSLADLEKLPYLVSHWRDLELTFYGILN